VKLYKIETTKQTRYYKREAHARNEAATLAMDLPKGEAVEISVCDIKVNSQLLVDLLNEEEGWDDGIEVTAVMSFKGRR